MIYVEYIHQKWNKCNYLKSTCTSMEKYYKNPDDYSRNYKVK